MSLERQKGRVKRRQNSLHVYPRLKNERPTEGMTDIGQKGSLKISAKLGKDHNRPTKRRQVTSYVFELQKVDKHSRNSHKFKFSMKSLTFSCLMCALSL